METTYEPAAPHIPCEDNWNPGTMKPDAAEAYLQVEREGLIRIMRAQTGVSTRRVSVRYQSAVPHEWAKQRLGKVRTEHGIKV